MSRWWEKRAVSRARIVVGLVAAVLLVGGIVVAADEFPLPTILPADDQRPLEPPRAGQQVAVLEVTLLAQGDKVTAEIRSNEVIDNFAPKSVARSAGEWEVRLLGGKEFKYLIPNPLLDVEVENPKAPADNPFDSVPVETLDWTLIVPLYDQGQPLGATRVQVVDTATGNTILETDIGKR